MFKKILLAIDGSQFSQRATVIASDMALKYEATLIIVHAFPHTSDVLGYDEFSKLVAKRKNAGQEIIDEARKGIDEGIEIIEELLEGNEAESILTVTETYDADLILMGTRGHGKLTELLIGSVSQKVLHHAKCPVMIVH